MTTLSVLIPNYNHGHHLGPALHAILGQTRPPTEVIVYDDGSTDDSVAVAEAMARRSPLIRVVTTPRNRGVVHGMNSLLDMATGELVVFCAADDVVLPTFFERSLGMLERHPEAGLSSALSLQLPGDGGDVSLFPSAVVTSTPAYLPPARAQALLVAVGTWIMGNTTVFRRDALIAAGGFRPELRAFTDGFVEQALAVRHGACFIPEPLCIWRRAADSYSAATLSDVGAYRTMMQTGADLMRSDEFRDVFPEAYVVRFEREARYSAALHALFSLQAQEREFVDRLAQLDPAQSAPDAAVLSAMRVSQRVHWYAQRAGLLLRYRPMLALRRRVTKRRVDGEVLQRQLAVASRVLAG